MSNDVPTYQPARDAGLCGHPLQLGYYCARRRPCPEHPTVRFDSEWRTTEHDDGMGAITE